jgi:cytochrome c
MSDLTANKIFGAGLGTAFVIAILGVITPMVFTKTPPKKPGYAVPITVDVGGGGGEAPDVPPDWGTVLKTADVSAGEAKTAACKACHNFDPSGSNNIGPGLYGVVGRKPGSHPGFSYSAGMTAFGGKQPVWDYQHLYEFLKGPQAYIDGTKMTFIGLKNPQDRINVIAYLHTLGSSLPIPAPNPVAAKAPAAAGAAAATPPANAATPPANAAAPAKAGD